MTSWISDLAGKAEDFLNTIDQNAADVAAAVTVKKAVPVNNNRPHHHSDLERPRQRVERNGGGGGGDTRSWSNNDDDDDGGLRPPLPTTDQVCDKHEENLSTPSEILQPPSAESHSQIGNVFLRGTAALLMTAEVEDDSAAAAEESKYIETEAEPSMLSSTSPPPLSPSSPWQKQDEANLAVTQSDAAASTSFVEHNRGGILVNDNSSIRNENAASNPNGLLSAVGDAGSPSRAVRKTLSGDMIKVEKDHQWGVEAAATSEKEPQESTSRRRREGQDIKEEEDVAKLRCELDDVTKALDESTQRAKLQETTSEHTIKSLEAECDRLRADNNGLSTSLRSSQNLVQRLEADLTSLQSLADQHSSYKMKAQKILQEKENTISSLKEGLLKIDSAACSTSSIQDHSPSGMEQLRKECDLYMGEAQVLNEKLSQLEDRNSTLEQSCALQTQALERCQIETKSAIDEAIREKVKMEGLFTAAEEELRFLESEMSRQTLETSAKLKAKDDMIDGLEKRVTKLHLEREAMAAEVGSNDGRNDSSAQDQSASEDKVGLLTKALLEKQSAVEALSADKTNLQLQIERLEKIADTQSLPSMPQPGSHPFRGPSSNSISNRLQLNRRGHHQMYNMPLSLANTADDYYNSSSSNDNGVASSSSGNRGLIKKPYNALDKLSVRIGTFLRRYPRARIFVLLYMILMHLWLFLVLWQSMPAPAAAQSSR